MCIRASFDVTGKKFGVSELGADVITCISHATQKRLQNLLEKVSHVAQLKNQNLKVMVAGSNTSHSLVNLVLLVLCTPDISLSVHQEDGLYEQVSDVRAQLKFFEQLDRLERQRKEEQEREILLKAAKVTK